MKASERIFEWTTRMKAVAKNFESLRTEAKRREAREEKIEQEIAEARAAREKQPEWTGLRKNMPST